MVSNKTGDILSYGFNCSLPNHDRTSIHSEENAWYEFKRLWKNRQISEKKLRSGVTMINLALTPSHTIRMSKPCKKCSNFITKNANVIREVHWSDADGQMRSRKTSEGFSDATLSSGDKNKHLKKAKKKKNNKNM